LASFTERDGRWRALVRKAGQTRCATFDTKKAAQSWANTVERELDQLKASGVMDARGITVGELIDRYVRELYPLKPWGRSKRADLARLQRDLGGRLVSEVTSFAITDYFRKRHAKGSGAVVISAQAGYLVLVFEVARTVWHLDVPLQAVKDARMALAKVRLIGKAKRRDRRVTDDELRQVIEFLESQRSSLPMADIVRFALATGMRISEICQIKWQDLNTVAKTIIIRDRKHPSDKLGNDQIVPLLNVTGFDALEIVKRQPRSGPLIFSANSRTATQKFTKAVRGAGLEDLHLHDLRHEAISRLFAAGYRIEEVALVSGHRDWAMLKRYTHVRATDLHR
jgi:integrase